MYVIAKGLSIDQIRQFADPDLGNHFIESIFQKIHPEESGCLFIYNPQNI